MGEISTHSLINKVENCCGCSACANICPTKSITMEYVDSGFKYPVIHEESCVSCKKCLKICPLIKKTDLEETQKEPVYYGGWTLDEHIRLNSSSGGIFSVLALNTLSKGGSVYGASFSENLSLNHVRITDEKDLPKLRGSKYIQSNIGSIYHDVLKDLKQNTPVLFSGTPCQIGGLVSFLGKKYANLLLVDVICHGVPSSSVFKNYIKWQESRYKGKAEGVFFRDKTTGWKNYSMSINFDTGQKTSAKFQKDPFMQTFLMDICLRKSCYSCLYRQIPRIADITLGDLWGVENIDKELDDDRGVSLVIGHTLQGKNAIKEIVEKKLVFLKKIDYIAALKNNTAYNKNIVPPKDYQDFSADEEVKAFDRWVKPFYKKRNRPLWFRLLKRIYLKTKKILHLK